MQISLVITRKQHNAVATALGMIPLLAGEAMARQDNYNANAAGNASSQGQNNANCNSALRRDTCEREAAYAEALATSNAAQPAPEPGACLLLGTAILMLFAVKKLSRHNVFRPNQGSSQIA